MMTEEELTKMVQNVTATSHGMEQRLVAILQQGKSNGHGQLIQIPGRAQISLGRLDQETVNARLLEAIAIVAQTTRFCLLTLMNLDSQIRLLTAPEAVCRPDQKPDGAVATGEQATTEIHEEEKA